VPLWFEDDRRVAYAYLKRGEKFVADVWVYNRAESPTAPEWKEGKRPPFLNVRSCIAEIVLFALPTSVTPTNDNAANGAPSINSDTRIAGFGGTQNRKLIEIGIRVARQSDLP